MRKTVLILLGLAIAGMGYGCKGIDSKGSAETHPQDKQQILLTNLSVFDVNRGTMGNPQDILLAGDKIVAVGELAGSSEFAERLDCAGKYAVPGLFDCHAHLAFLTTKAEEDMEKTLKGFLACGVTNIRDVGGPVAVMKKMSESTVSGKIMGPEMFYTGPMLERSPLHWGKFNEGMPDFTVAVNTTEDVDRILPELAMNGASMVKTFNKMDMKVFEHLVEVAGKHSLLIVHDPGSPLFHQVPMDKAIDLGVTSIEHAKAPWPVVLKKQLRKEHDALMMKKPGMPEMMAFTAKICSMGSESVSRAMLDRLCEKMVTADVFLCPTLRVFAKMKDEPPAPSMPLEAIEMQKKIIAGLNQVSAFFTGELAKRGVKLLVGQDGIDPHGTLEEMELMRQCGVDNAEIIKGATIYPARWLGVESRLGSIQPRREASILILDKNPLEDISNIKSAFLVIQRGQIVFQAEPKDRVR